MVADYPTAGAARQLGALAGRLNRSLDGMISEAGRLGLRARQSRRVAWTAERCAYLGDHYGAMSDSELAEALGCTDMAFRRRVQIEGLTWRMADRQLTAEQATVALLLVGKASYREIAAKLGRSEHLIGHLVRRVAGGVKNIVVQREMAYLHELARLRILLAHAKGMLTIVEAAALLGTSYAEVSKAVVMEAVRGAGLAPDRKAAAR